MKEIDVIGVTKGPGLAIALGVGVNKAKELALKYGKNRPNPLRRSRMSYNRFRPLSGMFTLPTL